ncbi:MAG: hypothetical protein JO235_02290 [Chroococcidiopsidaceae cyanobacterium CP_BM_RX_35]|nr:hypothetical protein [Chroococcidiopsidaceae cyanobacterium CP_BM_RX_35]
MWENNGIPETGWHGSIGGLDYWRCVCWDKAPRSSSSAFGVNWGGRCVIWWLLLQVNCQIAVSTMITPTRNTAPRGARMAIAHGSVASSLRNIVLRLGSRVCHIRDEMKIS